MKLFVPCVPETRIGDGGLHSSSLLLCDSLVDADAAIAFAFSTS